MILVVPVTMGYEVLHTPNKQRKERTLVSGPSAHFRPSMSVFHVTSNPYFHVKTFPVTVSRVIDEYTWTIRSP